MRFGGLIAAIVFAAIAAVIVLRMSSGDSQAPTTQQIQPVQQATPLKTTNVFVAAAPIPIGATITQDMVAIQPWPEHLVLEGFIRSDAGVGAVVGMIARSSFQPQEPILRSKLANANDPNFLAGALPKGMRVVTIQTNETEGLAGFIFPGDHIDVLWTHDVDRWVSDPAGSGTTQPPHRERETVTETLINNVKIVAVDQRASGGNTDPNGKPAPPRSVSLMVSQSDAQRLRLGQQKGTLTLELRALVDRETSDPMTITTTRELTQFPDATPTGTGDNATVLIVRGVSSAPSPVSNAGASAAAPAPPVATPAPQPAGAPRL